MSDYASNVYEVKINGDLSLFSDEDKQWIKNDGKTIFTYDGPEKMLLMMRGRLCSLKKREMVFLYS